MRKIAFCLSLCGAAFYQPFVLAQDQPSKPDLGCVCIDDLGGYISEMQAKYRSALQPFAEAIAHIVRKQRNSSMSAFDASIRSRVGDENSGSCLALDHFLMFTCS
jgi:hypothetical protein